MDLCSAALKSGTLGDFFVHHLGPLDAAAVVLVVGRNNAQKRSASIEGLLGEVHKAGLTVCWFERQGIRNARLRAAALGNVQEGWLHAFALRHPVAGAVATKAVRLYLKLKYPKRRHHVLEKLSLVSDALDDLRLFLRMLPAREVFVVSHSAGGIAASLVESDHAIQRTICFGYPFKHPDRPEETHRTTHLSGIQKPLLIIQGSQDAYGTAQDALRYTLSSQIVVAPVESDHDYDQLDKASFDKVLQLILPFLGVEGWRRAHAGQADSAVS